MVTWVAYGLDVEKWPDHMRDLWKTDKIYVLLSACLVSCWSLLGHRLSQVN